MNPLLLGLLIGAAFGAVLVLTGLSNPRLILGMLRLRNLHLFKLLVTAIGVGIAGIALLDSAGLAHTGVKTTHVLANLGGGAIFGLGFALAGYCPGTALAGAAEGRRDAIFAVLGGLLGTAAFAAVYETVLPILIEPLTLGKATLPSILGVSPLWLALPIGAGVGVLAWAWISAERRGAIPAEPHFPIVAERKPSERRPPRKLTA
jgi:uncharacterized membrane protein YedE/YeeE